MSSVLTKIAKLYYNVAKQHFHLRKKKTYTKVYAPLLRDRKFNSWRYYPVCMLSASVAGLCSLGGTVGVLSLPFL